MYVCMYVFCVCMLHPYVFIHRTYVYFQGHMVDLISVRIYLSPNMGVFVSSSMCVHALCVRVVKLCLFTSMMFFLFYLE